MVQLPAMNTPQFDWVQSRLPRKPQPVPPIYQPEVAAEAIFWAAHHRRRELWSAGRRSQAIVGNKLAPGLLDRYLARTGYDAQQTDEPEDPDRPDNLWEPAQATRARTAPSTSGPAAAASSSGRTNRGLLARRSRRSGRRRTGDFRDSILKEGPMAQQVADYVLERLSEWGVHRVFGYPGDGINGSSARSTAPGRSEFIQARHEEMAAFMACAHAKFTGEIGVCIATSGPGAIHLLNGLYDAKLDHQPVVAIVGQQARTSIGGALPAGGRPTTLFKDVCTSTCTTCMRRRRRRGT